MSYYLFFFFKQKTAYEMRISDWSSDVCSSDLKFAALGAPTSASDFWQLGFEASWELDLWGRARRSREGAAAAFEATVYEREAARVALSAEVARAYLQLRGAQAQLDITRQNLEVADRTLRRSEEHTSELQSLMRISYAVFCLKKK